MITQVTQPGLVERRNTKTTNTQSENEDLTLLTTDITLMKTLSLWSKMFSKPEDFNLGRTVSFTLTAAPSGHVFLFLT